MSRVSTSHSDYVYCSLDTIKNSKNLLDELSQSKQHSRYKKLNVIVINSVLMTPETRLLIFEKIKSFEINENIGICIYAYGSSLRTILKPIQLTSEIIPLIGNILTFNNDYILTQNENDIIKSIQNELMDYNNVTIYCI